MFACNCCRSAFAPSLRIASPAAARPVAAARVVCSAERQEAGKQLGTTAAAAALAIAFGFGQVDAAYADIAGLTPCSESKAFAKRKKNEVKGLNKRLKQYEAGSAPALALTATIEKTEKRFDNYGRQGLLCGTDGLPHLIADPGLALRYGHAGDVLVSEPPCEAKLSIGCRKRLTGADLAAALSPSLSLSQIPLHPPVIIPSWGLRIVHSCRSFLRIIIIRDGVDQWFCPSAPLQIPTVGFLYFAGWIGYAGTKYVQEVKKAAKPIEKEIIIDVPLAWKLLWVGLGWPIAAVAELRNGTLLEDDANITVSPR